MSDPAVRMSQAERRSRSEDALLDAAAELVAERGIHGASLASIGNRAGVSRGLPTHHFGSKDALVTQLAERSQERIRRAMIDAERDQEKEAGELTALEEIVLVVDTYLELFEEPAADHRALLVMWGATFPSSASVEGMTDAENRSYEGLSEHIQAGQRDNSVRADVDPAASAVLLHGLMRGVAALFLTDCAPADMTTVRRACRQWVVNALGSVETRARHSSDCANTAPPFDRH